MEAAFMAVMGAANAVIEYGWAHFDRHRRVRRDTSSVEILASKAVAWLPLVSLFWIQELTEHVIRFRVGWLSLGHPMS